LPQWGTKGYRARTPDGTLWLKGENTWDRVWFPLLNQWGDEKEVPVEAAPSEAKRFMGRQKGLWVRYIPGADLEPPGFFAL
jgi:hypothetical protein